MSFQAWFKEWRRFLYRLFMVGTKPYKSDSQRKKEHKRYVKSKSPNKGRYRVIEKKKRSRHGGNYNVLSALLGFMASTLSIVLLPFGLLHWGYKSAKNQNGMRKTAHQSEPHLDSNPQPRRSAQNKTVSSNTLMGSVPKTDTQCSYAVEQKEKAITEAVDLYKNVQSNVGSSKSEPTNVEPDETIPKSTPQNEKDQYIRKRMIISGSFDCNKNILSRLQIGSYIEVTAEPNNPYDKDAVKLLYDGEKIGYISKKDKLPFVTCLKLGRKVYGVITDIINDDFSTKYEFETWFENR